MHDSMLLYIIHARLTATRHPVVLECIKKTPKPQTRDLAALGVTVRARRAKRLAWRALRGRAAKADFALAVRAREASSARATRAGSARQKYGHTTAG